MYTVCKDWILICVNGRLITLDKSKESFDIVHELFPNNEGSIE